MMSKIDAKMIVAGNNDRTVFDPKALADLADNIRQNGLIQPITVRQLEGSELYQIVAGERRFRACTTILKWKKVPAIVADLTDEEAASVMLAENVSRADIDAIDEANAYATRMQFFGWSAADCAKRAGVTDIRVQFRLKLLRLRPDIQGLVRSNNVTIGYAQILADADLDTDRQMIAIAHLRDNPKPSLGWWRRLVNEILAQQAQGCFIEDLPILTGAPMMTATTALLVEPPHPSTTQPASFGNDAHSQLESQVSFWQDAAEAWDKIGKPFKRQECQAAANALQFALQLI